MKGVNIILADGFEDMEAIATRDVLLRAGIQVKTVSIGDYMVTSSHGLEVCADSLLEEIEEDGQTPGKEDIMIFPGGMPGSRNLAENEGLMALMKEHFNAGGTVAAICAAPGLVASQLDLPASFRFTCFDGFEGPLQAKGGIFTAESVTIDGRLITGRGAGHAVNFGLAIAGYILGSDTVAKVRHGLML